MNNTYSLHKNPIVRFLEKPAKDFTKQDIIKYIEENEIQMVNFMYPAGDGRLKTLNFVINDRDYLETILTSGERVDGSSLFSFIEAGSSDLYVIPRFRTAFLDPFAEIPTLTMLCSFFDKDGNLLATSPEATLHKACEQFTKTTGLEFHAMGELEYYVIAPDEGRFRQQTSVAIMSRLHLQSSTTSVPLHGYDCADRGRIKYGHSEVGNFTLDGMIYEQNEIEFLPVPAEEAADQLMVAKWVIRVLGAKLGFDVTFAPKITTGKAGSGLHIHMRLMKDGHNMMLNADRTLSDDAKRMIAGLMDLAPSITAFGNTNPTSYFRLVPHQEAPTNVCWGDRNRSVLVRVPLGWTAKTDMCVLANPTTPSCNFDASQKQTVEIRSADGSADVYQLLAGLAVAARHGFEMPDALEVAERTYVNVNIHDDANADRLATLAQLPTNCAESVECLDRQRKVYEEYGVFSACMINGIMKMLSDYNDTDLARLAKEDKALMQKLVNKYFYCG